MIEKETNIDTGFNLVQDLEEVTRLYHKMNENKKNLAAITSAASVAYLYFVQRNIINSINNEEDKKIATKLLKEMIITGLDDILKESLNKETSNVI